MATDDFRLLLEKKITAEEYVRRLDERIQARKKFTKLHQLVGKRRKHESR